jgi:hypothetical protein
VWGKTCPTARWGNLVLWAVQASTIRITAKACLVGNALLPAKASAFFKQATNCEQFNEQDLATLLLPPAEVSRVIAHTCDVSFPITRASPRQCPSLVSERADATQLMSSCRNTCITHPWQPKQPHTLVGAFWVVFVCVSLSLSRTPTCARTVALALQATHLRCHCCDLFCYQGEDWYGDDTMFNPALRGLDAGEGATEVARTQNEESQPNTQARVLDPPPRESRLLFEDLRPWQKTFVVLFIEAAAASQRHITWVPCAHDLVGVKPSVYPWHLPVHPASFRLQCARALRRAVS